MVTPFLLGQPLYNNTEVTPGCNYIGCIVWELFSGTPLCGEQLFRLHYRCLPHHALQSQKQNGWQHTLFWENNCLELFLKQSENTRCTKGLKWEMLTVIHIMYKFLLKLSHSAPVPVHNFFNAPLWNNLIHPSFQYAVYHFSTTTAKMEINDCTTTQMKTRIISSD